MSIEFWVQCDDCHGTWVEQYPDGLDGNESYSSDEYPKPCECDAQYTIIRERVLA